MSPPQSQKKRSRALRILALSDLYQVSIFWLKVLTAPAEIACGCVEHRRAFFVAGGTSDRLIHGGVRGQVHEAVW